MTTPATYSATLDYTAPCLTSGPLSGHARALVDAADALETGAAVASKARLVNSLFDGMEAAFATDADPLPALLEVIEAGTRQLDQARAAGAADGARAVRRGRDERDIVSITADHYGRLFREFSPPSYFDEPSSLLRARLQRNSIEPSSWSRKTVLDAGCGGGRYTVAWRMLGARRVTGVDLSESGITDARRRIAKAHVNGVQFDRGDVLALPYEANQFAVVFSNGVLHHTVDWRRGISELVRVLEPAGLGWLYVIENPGGYFWDVIEMLRLVMRNEERDAVRRALADDAVPANRIFYMLDHVMVPINIRLTPHEVEDALRQSGAIGIRRLRRGADFDRVEALHRGDPYAREKYGVGENRYVFTKA